MTTHNLFSEQITFQLSGDRAPLTLDLCEVWAAIQPLLPNPDHADRVESLKEYFNTTHQVELTFSEIERLTVYLYGAYSEFKKKLADELKSTFGSEFPPANSQTPTSTSSMNNSLDSMPGMKSNGVAPELDQLRKQFETLSSNLPAT